MDGFRVLVQTRAPGSERAEAPGALADGLRRTVAPYDGECAVDEAGWEVRLSVDAEDAVVAGAVGAALARNLAVQAGVPEWPVVRVDAARSDLAS